MVSPVNSAATVARLAAVLQQLSGPRASSRLRKAEPARPQHAATLAQTLHKRLLALQSTPKCDVRSAARVVIETLLTNEFGGALAADPAFQAVIDDVLETMEGSPTLAADVERLMAKVLGPRSP